MLGKTFEASKRCEWSVGEGLLPGEVMHDYRWPAQGGECPVSLNLRKQRAADSSKVQVCEGDDLTA